MGIAGFFQWLQRNYASALELIGPDDEEAAANQRAAMAAATEAAEKADAAANKNNNKKKKDRISTTKKEQQDDDDSAECREDAAPSAAAVQEQTPEDEQAKRIENVCKFFNSAQGCRHGASCRFSHVELSEDDTTALQQRVRAAPRRNPLHRPKEPHVFDNLYLDMNGLIHPCCHDTAPLPEPSSEEEMFSRIFKQIDELVDVVRPRKCLVLAVDGVAPRSKMNQQRARRFRAATERRESVEIYDEMVEVVKKLHDLPVPPMREKWDHNVITPSTPFMERMGEVLEWYVLKRLNSNDPLWADLTVVLSDAHVPGEGEHKVMHYIRSLRACEDYDPMTSHVIFGMDADLICLGLVMHELNFHILRNQLDQTTKQPVIGKYCVFNLRRFRGLLRKDFSSIEDKMNFERVIDDFIFLCFFIGNDFLPHMPLVDIKQRGIETMLDHYVLNFGAGAYLTKNGEILFGRLRSFLESFVESRLGELLQLREYRALYIERTKAQVEERVEELTKKKRDLLHHRELVRGGGADGADGDELEDDDELAIGAAVLQCYVDTAKEQRRHVGGMYPLPFEYGADGYRDAYYTSKFGWTPPSDAASREEFEGRVATCCREYLRGMQWVMRYYTVGCPSWEWFYPYHFAPLVSDVSKFCFDINVEMKLGEPLHPVHQLLSVLPQESYRALPAELHEHVLNDNSVLSKFYPSHIEVDFTEAVFAYQGVIKLPFINVEKMKRITSKLFRCVPDEGYTLVFTRKRSKLQLQLDAALNPSKQRHRHRHQHRSRHDDNAEDDDDHDDGSGNPKPRMIIIPGSVTSLCPIAGRIGPFEYMWPIGEPAECQDRGFAKLAEGSPIASNQVYAYKYEMNVHTPYRPRLLVRELEPDEKLSGKRRGRNDRED